MAFYPHGGGSRKFDDGGGGHGHSHGVARDEASCVVQQASSGGDSGSTLKAHDYIGLSEVSSMPASKASAPAAAVPDLNLGETELRLGPPKTVACKAQAESPAPLKDKPAPPTHWQAHRNMEAAPPAPATAQPQQPQPQEMSAPKSGAKRGFSEAIGNGFVEGRSVPAPVGSTPAASKQSTNPLMPYPWNSASAKLPAAWRMGLEQSKGGFGPFPSASRHKIDGGDNRSSWDNSASASPASTKLSQEQQQTNKDDSSDEVAQASSPPVVGWPPVQSFRKNTLASHPPPPPPPSQQKSSGDSKASTAAAVAAAATNVAAPPHPAPAAAAPGGTSQPLFVKVYMDGVPIGRKVDLKSHNSYDKLSTVLEEMFQRFVSGQNGEVSSPSEADQHKKLSFLHGSEFVLTYEDKDGDLMLVGDVPWGMFTGTVKRLRIMKGSEAIGLAPRTAGDNKAAA